MAYETCETVKIVAPVTDANPLGYVVINATDKTDADVLFDAPVEAAPTKGK